MPSIDSYTTWNDPLLRRLATAAPATREDAIRRAELILRTAGVKADIVPRHPAWKAGDVVVVYYGPQRTPYTYVRGRETWPADGDRPAKADGFMNEQYDRDRLKPVLQAGGVPFERTRL
ncbi:hypothetical protein OG792_32900 [Micromonospora sp. NBC_01699]|uniref:hypothetical protein n=1 Tax=Micromonospora sp. NBC_01699 TaxID=2975984 RepID=UPI002E2D2D21|nr:hypothetical protein [Micromonospora sp. NBC_01699]